MKYLANFFHLSNWDYRKGSSFACNGANEFFKHLAGIDLRGCARFIFFVEIYCCGSGHLLRFLLVKYCGYFPQNKWSKI